jgi:hypothetical protein
LLPVYFASPSVNLGFGTARGPPHLVGGKALLRRFGIKRGPEDAPAFTYLDSCGGENLRQVAGGLRTSRRS